MGECCGCLTKKNQCDRVKNKEGFVYVSLNDLEYLAFVTKRKIKDNPNSLKESIKS